MCIPAKNNGEEHNQEVRRPVVAKLRREKAGFRPGRGTTEQAFTLQNIIEQSLEWNESFIDYEKAFNSIHQDTPWKIMKH